MLGFDHHRHTAFGSAGEDLDMFGAAAGEVREHQVAGAGVSEIDGLAAVDLAVGGARQDYLSASGLGDSELGQP